MDLIHAAAQWGLQPMVERLAREEPALVNAPNEFGWTCLMLACSGGHVGLAAWLLDHGACLEQGDRDGFTALTHAACGRQGRAEAVTLLLARGADPNAAGPGGSTALMEAARLGLAGRVQALVAGAAAEGPLALDLDARDAKGSTALFKACMYGRLGAVRVLLAAGADPTVPNEEGLTPMLATLGPRHHGKRRAIAELLERAMLEPCRVRLLRQARFAHQASSPASTARRLLLPPSAAEGQRAGAREEEEEEEAVMMVDSTVVATPAVLAFQAQRRAEGRPLPRVEVRAPPLACTCSTNSPGRLSSRKRPRSGSNVDQGEEEEAAATSVGEGSTPRGSSSTSSSSSNRSSSSSMSAVAAAASVARHVVSGGLGPAAFEELVGLMTVRWDPSKQGEAVGAVVVEGAVRGQRAWVEAHREEVARLSARRRWLRRRRRRLQQGGEEEELETTGDEEDVMLSEEDDESEDDGDWK